MSERRKETLSQAVRRHLRNGYIIFSERGLVALYGAAMREAAKLIDSPVGTFLAPRDIMRDGSALVKSQGLRVAIAAVLRQIAAENDPPLGRSRNPANEAMRLNALRYLYTYELTRPDGVVPSRRPVNDVDYALEVPFKFAPHAQSGGPVAAVVHTFYPEELQALLDKLVNIPCAVDLYLSTDTDAKKAALSELTAYWSKGAVEIRVLPNRGRDIGAKFIGFRDVYARYDLFVHLHTKKSPHGGTPLARWRDYLLDNLLGSPEIAASNLALFDDPKLGVVFPQHLFEIRGILNWGYDYDLARALMRRIGVEIDKNLVLEFPSGSMFWGRSAAIRPLLDAGLSYDDFAPESGQVDGTLAHAIERVVLMVAESCGYEWLKVVRRELYPAPNTVLAVESLQDIPLHRLKVFQPCLIAVDAELPPYARVVKETRPIGVYPSRNERPRLNLIAPTVNPHQTFGGVATALELFSDWADLLGDGYDRRIIVTDADIEPEAYAALPDYTPTSFSPSLDSVERALVDANDRNGGRLDMRARDVFVATAWWTADFVRAIENERARCFGGRRPFVYLIQDDEPNFYGWSTKSALAEATYRTGEDAIAVINSEELYGAITAKHSFREAFCLPYLLNARIAEKLAPRPRERIILVYGRPSVVRNAFELICEGLRRWQQRDPIRASRWRIVFLGETFETALAYPVQNVNVEGKVSLDAYADYLSRAAVGVSLMISPHPSYPPLEMAEAGVATIVNAYAGKDLHARFAEIVALDILEPECLASAIEEAVAQMEPLIGVITPRRGGVAPKAPGPLADAGRIAALIRAALD
jgi:hypothetical protein